jgi:predicted nucleotidyltransferase
MILTKEHIKEVVQDYFKDKPIKKVYLFGSYARDEANEKSDVDLLVDIDYEKKIGWQFFGWYSDLEKQFEKNVDVVSSNGLSKHIASFIHGDKMLIYAK